MAEQINISIDEEFKDLLRPLSSEEYDNLEESIRTLGMAYDPIILWGDTIIDGHHRYGICTHGGFDYTTLELDFDSRDEAKQWIVDKQVGRRNLNDMEASYYRGLKYNKAVEAIDYGEIFDVGSEVAKEEGVSHSTIKRDGKLAEQLSKVEDEVKDKILSADIKPTRKEIKEISKMSPKGQHKAVQSIEEGKGIEYEDLDGWLDDIAAPYKTSINHLRFIKKKMEELSSDPVEGKYVASKFTRIKHNLDELIDSISQCMPVSACDDCGGVGCNNCYGTGFLSRAAKESQDK